MFSLACYIVTLISVAVFIAATVFSRMANAADYGPATGAVKSAMLVEIGAPKVQAMAEAWASSVAYSYVPRNVLDPIIFVSMTVYKKNLLIREVKSPMLTHVSHNFQLTSDTFSVVTIWRF